MSDSSTSRTPGWYPDPWGTPDERFFDGGAWTRRTRPVGGMAAAPVTPLTASQPGAAGGASPTGFEATDVSPPVGVAGGVPAGPPPSVPPGWYGDPWGAASLRWWDGTQWTGHLAPVGPSPLPSVGSATVILDDERVRARWARLGLLWGGPAAAASALVSAVQMTWVADNWSEVVDGSTTQIQGDPVVGLVGNIASLVFLTCGVLFMLWFHRAATVAARAGLSARRTPGLATWSFVIPVVNLWWPYQSTLDLLPAQHPARRLVARWWTMWVGQFVVGLGSLGAAFVSDALTAVLATMSFILVLGAAIAGRAVVAEVLDAHEHLVGATPATA